MMTLKQSHSEPIQSSRQSIVVIPTFKITYANLTVVLEEQSEDHRGHED